MEDGRVKVPRWLDSFLHPERVAPLPPRHARRLQARLRRHAKGLRFWTRADRNEQPTDQGHDFHSNTRGF
jgi:hypothetical protein